MAKAYGSVMVICATGFVFFALIISTLAFFYPEKASNFLVLYAVPVAGLLGFGGIRAKEAWLATIQKKKP